MSDINGAASLKPAIGVFTSTGGTSEGGSATLIGIGHLDVASNEEINAHIVLVSPGLYSATALSFDNAVANFIGRGTLTVIATNTIDLNINLIYLGCAAIYAAPSISIHDGSCGGPPKNFIGTGIFNAIGNATIINNIELIGCGKSLNNCFIASTNNCTTKDNSFPIDTLYDIHINRIVEEKSVNIHFAVSEFNECDGNIFSIFFDKKPNDKTGFAHSIAVLSKDKIIVSEPAVIDFSSFNTTINGQFVLYDNKDNRIDSLTPMPYNYEYAQTIYTDIVKKTSDIVLASRSTSGHSRAIGKFINVDDNDSLNSIDIFCNNNLNVGTVSDLDIYYSSDWNNIHIAFGFKDTSSVYRANFSKENLSSPSSDVAIIAPQSGSDFGATIACNDRYTIIGAPRYTQPNAYHHHRGIIYIYDNQYSKSSPYKIVEPNMYYAPEINFGKYPIEISSDKSFFVTVTSSDKQYQELNGLKLQRGIVFYNMDGNQLGYRHLPIKIQDDEDRALLYGTSIFIRNNLLIVAATYDKGEIFFYDLENNGSSIVCTELLRVLPDYFFDEDAISFVDKIGVDLDICNNTLYISSSDTRGQEGEYGGTIIKINLKCFFLENGIPLKSGYLV